jgi:putative membrane protein
MKTWIINVLITTILLLLFANLFEAVYVAGFGAAFLASAILSIVHTFVRPVLIFLTLPLTLVSLGLFLFIINGFMLYMTDGFMGSSFEIGSFGLTILLSILLAFLHLVIRKTLAKPLLKRK